MRSVFVLGLLALGSAAFACSDGKDKSEVTPGDGKSGASTGTAGKSHTTGGTLNLGGSLGSTEGGAGDDGSMPDLPSEVNVIITADNAYGFGYGTKTELDNYFGGVENKESGDIDRKSVE